MKEIFAFTSTIPVEILYAAGHKPVDLNNIFITDKNAGNLVEEAKLYGFPDTTCAWICGLFSTIKKNNIKNIIGVTGGDCSETLALMEVLRQDNLNIIHFDYPSTPNVEEMQISLKKFANAVGADLHEAEQFKEKLTKIRSKVEKLDSLLWKENRGNSMDVQLLQLSCTDFEGNPDEYEKKVDEKLLEAKKLKPSTPYLRIGILGVPPIISNIYQVIEEQNALIVFSEVQRQFSIPFQGTLSEIYSKYTYPYGIYERLKDIKKAIRERKIDGLIHYVQSFCFRGIEDIVVKNELDIPILTLQGDLPSRVTATMEIRIEAFLDMLLRKKGINI